MKKTLLLFAMLLGVVGAWAQVVTPTPGAYYYIQSVSNSKYLSTKNLGTNNWNLTVVDNQTDAGIYTLIASGDNQFKLKCVNPFNGDCYIRKTGSTNFHLSSNNDTNFSLEEQDGSFYIVTGGKYLGMGNGIVANAGSKDNADKWQFVPVVPIQTYVIDNFNAAYTTWTNYKGNEFTSGWGYKVVHKATNITIHRIGNTNDLGWSTKSGIRYPYLVRGKSYILTVPEKIRILGYSIETTPEKNYNGEVSYTLANNEITITLPNAEADEDDGGVTIRKITLSYIEREDCKFILTDNAGNQYQGIYSAFYGVEEPTLTGSIYELSNKQWNEGTFTANITFPVPVSSETVANPTFISTYNYSDQPKDHFKWYASDNKIKVKEDEEIDYSSIASHLWLIYPKFNNGAFTFQIKNVATGLFINSSVDDTEHDDKSTVELLSEATDFTVGKRGNEGAEFINSFGKRLSVNTSKPNPADKIQTVGTYTTHYGTAVTFPDYMESTTWPEFVSTGTTLNPLVIAIGNDVKKTLVAKKLPSSADRYVHVTASNEEPELGYGQWTIYPAFSGNKIGFKIKNIATDTYIYAKPNGASEEYPVVLNAEGTAFDFADSKFAYTDGANTLYLSVPTNESYNLPLGVGTEADETRKTITFPEFSSYQVTIGTTGYTTVYSPFTAFTYSVDLGIYTITSAPQDGRIELNLITSPQADDVSNYILENQGVIIKGNSGTYTFYITDDQRYFEANAWTDNKLSGSFTNTYVQGDAYVLSAPGGVESVGLYKALLNKDANGEAGTSHFKNNAGKAYLPASALSAEAAESRFFLFGFGDDMETGIDELKGENGHVKTEVYDLSGRRVQGTQKGIFIVNGKKVVR